MFKTSQFVYDKETKKLVLSPLSNITHAQIWNKKEIEIVSTHTGVVMKFVFDVDLAIENDFWDGEQITFKPVTENNRVKNVIIPLCYL